MPPGAHCSLMTEPPVLAITNSTLTGPPKALWPGMCHLSGGLARLGSTGSFQRSPEPQLLALWPKAASAAVNALRRNRTSGTPKGVPTMWATRGVRESPAHRQSAFLLLEVLRPGQNHRALIHPIRGAYYPHSSILVVVTIQPMAL